MRGRAALLALLASISLAGAAAGTAAHADPAASCATERPATVYSSTAMAASVAVQLAPCRDGRNRVTMAVSLSLQRCFAESCGPATRVHRTCHGYRGTCSLALSMPHADPEVAAGYVTEVQILATSGPDVVSAGFTRDDTSCTSVGSATFFC